MNRSNEHSTVADGVLDPIDCLRGETGENRWLRRILTVALFVLESIEEPAALFTRVAVQDCALVILKMCQIIDKALDTVSSTYVAFVTELVVGCDADRVCLRCAIALNGCDFLVLFIGIGWNEAIIINHSSKGNLNLTCLLSQPPSSQTFVR